MRASVAAAALTPQLFVDGATRVAPGASVFAEIPFRGRVSVRSELFYSAEGSRITPYTIVTDDGRTIDEQGGGVYSDYVGVGAFVHAEAPLRGAHVGGYIGPAVSVKVRERNLNIGESGRVFVNPSDQFNRFQSSGVAGATARRGPIGIDARMALSLENVAGNAGSSIIRSRVASLGLSYGLGL